MSNAKNVSVGKPKIGGAIYRAPQGTAAPTAADVELAAVFKSLGYVSDNGVTNTNTSNNTVFRAWGGDTVETVQTDHTDTFTATLIEVINPDVLRTVYGDDNVTGTDVSTGLALSINNADKDYAVYVIDMVLKSGVLKRIVLPSAKVTSVGDVVYRDNQLIGYPVTISTQADDLGNTHYEYIRARQTGTSTVTVSQSGGEGT